MPERRGGPPPAFQFKGSCIDWMVVGVIGVKKWRLNMFRCNVLAAGESMSIEACDRDEVTGISIKRLPGGPQGVVRCRPLQLVLAQALSCCMRCWLCFIVLSRILRI